MIVKFFIDCLNCNELFIVICSGMVLIVGLIMIGYVVLGVFVEYLLVVLLMVILGGILFVCLLSLVMEFL